MRINHNFLWLAYWLGLVFASKISSTDSERTRQILQVKTDSVQIVKTVRMYGMLQCAKQCMHYIHTVKVVVRYLIITLLQISTAYVTGRIFKSGVYLAKTKVWRHVLWLTVCIHSSDVNQWSAVTVTSHTIVFFGTITNLEIHCDHLIHENLVDLVDQDCRLVQLVQWIRVVQLAPLALRYPKAPINYNVIQCYSHFVHTGK